MQDTLHLLANPHFWFLIGLYWIFMAGVGAMESPTPQDGSGYRWAYKFLHTLSANINAAFGNKIPGNITLTTKDNQGG